MCSRAVNFYILILTIQTSNSLNSVFKFPEGFLIGTASSAYQVEGALDADGRGFSNWDHLFREYPSIVIDGSNANVSCDFYHKYAEDIQNLETIGFQHYRFSLNWARILPTGYIDSINTVGVQHYHKILDELEKRGIKPIATIYHWDHPQNLEEEFGGWLSEKMIYLFTDYARVIFNEYGSRIKYYITMNEISHFCRNFVQIMNRSKDVYTCAHNMLKAHALTYHIYHSEFHSKHKGSISISVPIKQYYSSNENDQESADVAFEFHGGWIANPIFSKGGDYPEIMKKRIAERSRLQGYNISRLPEFPKEWIDLLRGSYDFFGLIHYTSSIVSPLPLSNMLNWPNDEGLEYSSDPNWATADSSWLKIYPEGFGDLLRRIKSKYGNPPIFVVENGVSDGNGTDDKMRTNYLYSYMKEMMKAMLEDGCDVRAYTIWSFTDSFEWTYGYTLQYGLVQIDFSDENRKRTMKDSISWLRSVLASRVLSPP